jgi:hypothetical protein
MERGGVPAACQFGLKALHAEQAGAAGAVIANNTGGTAIVLMASGEVGRQVTIPVIAISQDDGNTIRPTLPVSGTFEIIDVNGLHANGFPLLYTPAVLELGSTISHYDITAEPSALMEPAINLDLYNDPDITLGMYRDEGWVIGALFSDGFESGDTAALSATSRPQRHRPQPPGRQLNGGPLFCRLPARGGRGGLPCGQAGPTLGE